MKHSVKITLLLIAMFFVTQLIGIAVLNSYAPSEKIIYTDSGTQTVKEYNLPLGFNPPEENNAKTNLVSIIIAMIIAISLMFLLMKIRAETFLRIWFFFVVIIAISLTINSISPNTNYLIYFAILVGLSISYLKVFKRDIIAHNLSELLIYPGIAAILVPILTVSSVIVLLVIISLYDIYAVWHAGFMQKMAQFQIEKLKVFSGFFVPYKINEPIKISKKRQAKQSSKVAVAILGGGDVVFPILLSGVVMLQFGILASFIVATGATLALAGLFYLSEKGKFYPAMPFISSGCFLALALIYLIY